jgi:2-hydroxy-3-keto-5-methylthiopentenyl-1-phosphate phosphatase
MKALGQAHRRSVYVGDGRSDLCASRKADFRFAKGVLAECLEKESLPYVRFSTLADVAGFLDRAWQGHSAARAESATASAGGRAG